MKKGLLFVLTTLLLSIGFGQNLPKSKFGKGFNYMAADSSFTLKFHFRFQQLYITEFNDESEELSSNFLMRRSRLKFSGMAFSPKLKYKAELGLTNRDISPDASFGKGAPKIILDAVLKYQFSEHWALWAGQTKLPGNRERVISSANLQFVDRSEVNGYYTLDRDMGFQLRGKYKFGEMVLVPSLAISQGEGRDVTDGNQGGLSYTAHTDFLPFGAFTSKKGDYFGSDLDREETPKLSIGLTYNLNDRAVRQGGQLKSYVYDSLGAIAENTMHNFMADLIFKYQGWSVHSEYAYRTAEKEMINLSNGYRTGSGFNVQAGYLFPRNLELAGRFTTIRKDVTVSGVKDLDEFTLGLSRYFSGHNLKIQSDLSMIQEVGASDTDYRFRLQAEMQF